MIVPLALRLCATQALISNGATLAGPRIHDSAINAIDDLMKEVPVPVLVVATEDQTANPQGRNVTGGSDRRIDLVIEAAVAGAVVYEDGTIEVRLPTSDAALELSVDLLTRQAERILWHDDPSNAWGVLFRRIALGIASVRVRRGAGAEGTRFSARQITYTIQTINEPAFGKPLGEAGDLWFDFVAQIRADPHTAALADMIEAVIVGAPTPEWRRVWTDWGYSDAEADAIGLGSAGLPAGEEPPLVDEILAEDEETGVVLALDEAAAAEQFPEAP
jgi:hypothetical protein